MSPELGVAVIFPKGLDLEDAVQLLGPVAIYLGGIALYALFVFKF